jgi:hypothetical protein
MNILLAAFLSLGLLFAGALPSAAAPGDSGAGALVAAGEPAPMPPADVGPAPPGSEGGGLGMTELVIGAVVVGGAFAIGFATEGGLAAGIASAAAVLLIYSVLP